MRFQSSDIRSRREAFTLIELLVVVAIISLLISILLPAMQQARRQGKQVTCLTNLRNQGMAVHLYAQENKDWIVRGIMNYPQNTEVGSYATSVLRGLAYDGKVQGLWRPTNQTQLIEILRVIPQFQCPEHPDGRSVLDYVSSAMPIHYTRRNINADRAGSSGPPGDQYQGETPPDYVGTWRPSKIPAGTSLSSLIHVTEGHHSLPVNELRFHHFFYTSQLPFGRFPRTANDRRHPGGLTALFYDGHAVAMRHEKMDVGWPNDISLRLQWFTTMPPNYVPAP